VDVDGVGELEAFHTAGGLSTMAWRYEGAVPTMEYKTLATRGTRASWRPCASSASSSSTRST
jgi:lysine 6-dehydrogenase